MMQMDKSLHPPNGPSNGHCSSGTPDNRASEGKRNPFLLQAPVTGWKLMIHVLGRLRVSNKVTVCFPLQRLYAFLFWRWLQQQVLERRVLAEAEEKAQGRRI